MNWSDEEIEIIEKNRDLIENNQDHIFEIASDENFESGVVTEELQKGYTLKDRVIRASLVKVNE